MNSKNKLIEGLRDRIRSVEARPRVGLEQSISSGCVAIDRLLPAGGYGRGSLVQWITSGGNGADYLSLLAAKEACREGGSLVVIDQANQFFPPTAAAMGLPIERTVILRDTSPKAVQTKADQASRTMADAKTADSQTATNRAKSLEDNDFLWSIDQALRCPAVAAVWGALDTIDARWFRRFQLSAESSGCLGLFVQPLSAASVPTWADVQWLVKGLSSADRVSFEPDRNEQPVRLTLSRCRGTFAGKTVCLGINTVTGDVQEARDSHEPTNRLPVVPQLAHPAASRQPA